MRADTPGPHSPQPRSLEPTSCAPGPDSTTPRPWRGHGPVTAVLLDLDGTITDSAPVILDATAHTLRSFGLPVGSQEELMRFVGPPLTEGFRLYGGLEGADNAEAVRRYRVHYRQHMFEAPVYRGIPAVLARLRELGLPISLATSKREDYAVEILHHDGLADSFTVFAGADPADRFGAKADVVRLALQRLTSAGVNTRRVVHVGDRAHDVEGAHAAGVECIGVLWGYGDREELSQADWLVSTPEDLAALLTRLAHEPVSTSPMTTPPDPAVPRGRCGGRLGRGGLLGRARRLLQHQIAQADALRAAERASIEEAGMEQAASNGTPPTAIHTAVHDAATPAAPVQVPSAAASVLNGLPGWLVRGGIGSWLALGLIVVIALGFFAIAHIVPVFIGVFIALVVTAILYPLVTLFARVMPRFPATFLALLVAIGFVAGLVAYVVTSVTSQWARLASQFSTGVDTILDFVEHGPLPVHLTQQEATRAMQELVEQGQGYLESNATSLAGQVLSNAGSVVNVFVVLALALFTAIFFLASGGKMWRWFLGELPARVRPTVHRAAGAGWYTFAGYARGTVILAMTDAVMAGVFLQIVGVPLAAPLAVLVFIGAFIPMIGAPSAMIVAMIVALASKGFIAMVVVCLGVAGIGQIEGHILQPLIMGRQVSLHPVVVLLAVAVGTFSAGLLGAVVAVPLVSVAWSVYSELHVKDDPPVGELPGMVS